VCHQPITTKDINKLYTKEEYKDRMDALVCGKKKHFIDDCPNKPHTTIQGQEECMQGQSQSFYIKHEKGDHKHSLSSFSQVCLMAQGSIEISNFSKNNSDDEKLSFENVTKTFMFFEEDCHKQKKQRKQWKSKLGSSTSTYAELVGKFKVFINLNVELISKINKFESSANIATKHLKRKTQFLAHLKMMCLLLPLI
jgi:hypothetical protein